MIVVPAAGAAAGAFSFFMEVWGPKGGWKKIIARLIAFIAYVIALWLGSVLGLAGTLWH
jgi:hypothetical protein